VNRSRLKRQRVLSPTSDKKGVGFCHLFRTKGELRRRRLDIAGRPVNRARELFRRRTKAPNSEYSFCRRLGLIAGGARLERAGRLAVVPGSRRRDDNVLWRNFLSTGRREERSDSISKRWQWPESSRYRRWRGRP